MSNTGPHSQRQQSVKLAIDCETGELVPADALLGMPEPEFTALRRAAMAARRERRRGGDAVRSQRVAMERGVRAHQQFLRQARRGPGALEGVASDCILRVLVATVRRFMKWCVASWRRLPGGSRDR